MLHSIFRGVDESPPRLQQQSALSSRGRASLGQLSRLRFDLAISLVKCTMNASSPPRKAARTSRLPKASRIKSIDEFFER